MWSPTHVQVTVQKAKNLQSKGRKGTNDAFVLIQLGKEKYQTTIKSKAVDPEWFEECDLTLIGRDSDVILIVYHRNALGLDEFLGQTSISLQGIESFDRPFTKWYPLKGRSEKSEDKYRGELEIRIAFIVRRCSDTQSMIDLSFSKKKKHSLKHIATSVGHKIQKFPSRTMSLRTFDPRKRLERVQEKRESLDSETYLKDDNDIIDNVDDFQHSPMKRYNSLYSSTISLPQSAMIITSSIQEVDNSESHSPKNNSSYISENILNENKSSQLSNSNINEIPIPEPKIPQGEWTNKILTHLKESPLTRSDTNLSDTTKIDSPVAPMRKSKLETFQNNLRRHTLHLTEPPDLSLLKTLNKKNYNFVHKSESPKKYDTNIPLDLPYELVQHYEKMNHKDLVLLAIKQQADIEKQRDKILDLENYLDNLLVRVMETTPRILQKPYISPACQSLDLLPALRYQALA